MPGAFSYGIITKYFYNTTVVIAKGVDNMTIDPITRDGVEVLYDKEEVSQRITDIAGQIRIKYRGESVYMFCVLNGAAHFFCDLTSKIAGVDVVECYIRTSSYGSNTTSSGKVEVALGNSIDIEGKSIIIVEDIVDSGHTIKALLEALNKMSPESIEVCTLLSKPSRREVDDITIDYCGFEVPDEFIVGYGLDYGQKYRNYPFIGYIPKELLQKTS